MRRNVVPNPPVARARQFPGRMSAKSSRGKVAIRSDAHKKLDKIIVKSKVTQPKVAIRASSRLHKKEIIRNRSPLFPGTPLSAHRRSSLETTYLPDDVVINIFTIYLRLMEDSHLDQHDYPGIRATPFFLASVCFAWSRIARSTPCLWKRLDLHLDPLRYKSQCKLLRQWFNYTSGCDISVSVLTHLRNQLYWDAHLPRMIYEIVETRASQITNLAIPVFPDLSMQKMSGFHNLQRLRIDCGQYYFPQADVDPALEIEAPSLVRLQTFAVDARLVNIVDNLGNAAPLQGLQSLSTQVVTAHLTYETLRTRQLQHMPQLSLLTHLDISSLENASMPVDAVANDAPRLKFPHLRYLRCNSFVHIGSQIGFAPLLSTLVCYIPLLGNPEPEYLTEALRFLINAGCSRLEAFIVSSPDQLLSVYEDELLALLCTHPELRDVSIIGATFDEHDQGRYISDAFITSLCLVPPPSSDQESDTEPPQLLVPNLRSFTYCGPTDPHGFTTSNVWRTLHKRLHAHSSRTAPRPLKVFRIISTNPVSAYNDESEDTFNLLCRLCAEFPDLSAHIMENIANHEMYDAEKLTAQNLPTELKYLSYCDYPHGVGPDEPFDRDFFQLRFVMTIDERMTREYIELDLD